MKRKMFWMVLIAGVFISLNASARTVKMIFWYPGEAGSTKEAQPIIDEFFKLLNSKLSPDKIEGKYFNNLTEGIAYVKTETPVIGILSFSVWNEQKAKLAGASILLSTLPLPDGKTQEQYALAGMVDTFDSSIKLISSEPLGGAFVNSMLFSEVSSSQKIEQTNQMLLKLREIAQGSLKAIAILTPTEAAMISKLNQPWARQIKIIAKSKPVPTARVILFDKSWQGTEKLKSILLFLSADPSAKEILNELRLVGFAQ